MKILQFAAEVINTMLCDDNNDDDNYNDNNYDDRLLNVPTN